MRAWTLVLCPGAYFFHAPAQTCAAAALRIRRLCPHLHPPRIGAGDDGVPRPYARVYVMEARKGVARGFALICTLSRTGV